MVAHQGERQAGAAGGAVVVDLLVAQGEAQVLGVGSVGYAVVLPQINALGLQVIAAIDQEPFFERLGLFPVDFQGIQIPLKAASPGHSRKGSL